MVAGSIPVLCDGVAGVVETSTLRLRVGLLIKLKICEAVAEWLKALDCKSNGFPSWVRIPSASIAQHKNGFSAPSTVVLNKYLCACAIRY